MKIALGYEDYTYAEEASYRAAGVRRRKRVRGKAAQTTTAQVGAFLEKRYHILEFFAEKYGEDLEEALLEVYNPILEQLDEGVPLNVGGAELSPDAEMKLREKFIGMIENREMDGQPGVPTKASMGYTTRKGKRIRRRPSFRNTGLLEHSFRAWLEE